MTPFTQKLVWTILGIATYVLTAWPALASIAEVLKPVAGGIIMSVWVPRPGDLRVLEVGREAIRRSERPPFFDVK